MNALMSWEGLLAMMLGGLYGAVFGAIPGLTATLAVALFIPFAYFLDPLIAIPAIIAISSVAIYAGDVGSAIARIPGTPASAAYTDELFFISKEKSPIYGLGLSAMGSCVGGLIGTLILMLSATGIAGIAAGFSSFEYFWIAVLGLTAGIFASSGSNLKAFISLLLGLFFSTIGLDPTMGSPRFDFGNSNLLAGLNYIVAMIGLFGFSEVLEALFRKKTDLTKKESPHKTSTRLFFIQPLALILKEKWMMLRSAFVGIIAGFLPGAGADIGAWLATSIQKINKSDQSNEAAEKVVLAGSGSNNAAVASAWIPALSLGLPGDTITAIVLGVFMMKGISPGPSLFQQNMELIWALFGTFLLSNVILLSLFGFLSARLASRLVKIPQQILLSIIAGICIVGAFAINHNWFDVWVMAAMGGLALLLKRGDFPLAQVVLGMVLGPIMEQNFMMSAIKSRWNAMAFFERPTALILMGLTLVIIFLGLRYSKKISPKDLS